MPAERTFGGVRVRTTGGADRNGSGDGPLVVLLHGFGAPGDDLVPLWRVIDAPAGTRFFFPEALLDLGGGARAWWEIDMMRLQLAVMSGDVRDLTHEIPAGLAEARRKIEAMLDAIAADPAVAPRDGRLWLGGFSQGAMLSLDVVVRSPERPLAGLLVLSGTLLAEEEWLPLFRKRKGLRVLQSHGTDDPILPFSIAERLRDEMKTAGLDVTWVPFRGGHGVAPQVTDAIGRFLGDTA